MLNSLGVIGSIKLADVKFSDSESEVIPNFNASFCLNMLAEVFMSSIDVLFLPQSAVSYRIRMSRTVVG